MWFVSSHSAIVSEIPAQLILFLKLFQFFIHPVDPTFADHFDGDGLSLCLLFYFTEGLQAFGQAKN